MSSLFAPLAALLIASQGFLGSVEGPPGAVAPEHVSTPEVTLAVTFSGARETAPAAAVATGWRAQAEDNIVGLRDPKKLSNPSLVDYSALMAATAEMKRIKREGIDESSPEGIQLKNRAAGKVATACETVMNAEGHCSVWKTISHEDGRTITDLTTKVKRRL
ncbi:MAG: hypothetical protein ACYS26_04395 [Planctomycetota bacterium]|jgi:hypothetical protein